MQDIKKRKKENTGKICIVYINKSLRICYQSQENHCESTVGFFRPKQKCQQSFQNNCFKFFSEILSPGIPLFVHQCLLIQKTQPPLCFQFCHCLLPQQPIWDFNEEITYWLNSTYMLPQIDIYLHFCLSFSVLK